MPGVGRRRNRVAPTDRGWHCPAVPTNYFDEPVADRYDVNSADMFEPAVVDPAVAFLADLAGGGSALELGIGTGRIALPPASAG